MKYTCDFVFRTLIIPSARHAIIASMCIFCSALVAQNEPNSPSTIKYRTAASVLSLPYGVAAQGGYAKVTGIVTLASDLGLVVHDQTGGIWVDPQGFETKYVPGDEVEVVGPIGPGQYSPRIAMPRIRLIGHRRLPIPKKVTFQQLSSGQEDVQYVSIEGTIRAISSRSNVASLKGIALSIAMPEGRVDAILLSHEPPVLSNFVDAKVRVTATVLYRKNDNMQATGVVLVISDASNIEVIRPGPPDPFTAPILPIGNLMRYRSGTDYFHPVRVRGALTFYEPGNHLILQDGTQAIEVFSADSPHLQIGDRIEAVGYPAPDATGPILRDAMLRRLGHGTPLEPVPLTLKEASSSKYRFCLVSIQMQLLRVIDEPSRTLLLLEQGNMVTTAELESKITVPLGSLTPGSAIRVAGINVLTGETGLIYGNSIQSKLLLRTLNDATVISPAPWWTTTRLLYLSMALGALALGILFLLLYVQLKRWNMETVMQERERLARDIHDTLAQSFAGIGFQLQVIRRSVANNEANTLHHVDVARKLVQFSHREARKSLNPASDHCLSHGDLLSALKACAQGLAESGGVEIEVSCSQHVIPLPGALAEQMFHIGQEAIANAIRHANPTRVLIALDYRTDSVQLKIVDNGAGFTMSGDLLGFGIRGMRKRASEISGELEIASNPGAGTCVSITVPVRRRNKLVSSVITGFDFVGRFLESKINARGRGTPNSYSDR